jgi:hypothetical protein
LLGGLAIALFGGDPAGLGGPAGSPSPSVTASPSSPSPSSTPSPTPPADPVEAALADLLAVVDAGVADGAITDSAAADIRGRADEAYATFQEGDTETATEDLRDLRDKVDELVSDGEIAHSQEQRLDKAIDDLGEQMLLASPQEGD